MREQVGTVDAFDDVMATELAQAVHLVTKPSIKMTERDHAGNRHRAATASGKTKSWRRQCGQYIINRCRQRFLKVPGGKRRLTYISSLSWKQFSTRSTMTARRGTGGNGMRAYINELSQQHGGMNLNRAEFAVLRKQWAEDSPKPSEAWILSFGSTNGMCQNNIRFETCEILRVQAGALLWLLFHIQYRC
jgi:hypothetical protein